MSCSRVSGSSPPPRSAGERRLHVAARRPRRPGPGRRRSRPTPRTPRPGRRRRASCARRSAAAGPRRTRPAWSRRSGWSPAAGRRARRRRRRRARARSCPRPARPARRPAATASSSSATTCGNASRKNPEMRTVTSMRGRPSSASGTTSKPVTRRDASSQTGRQPEQRQHLGDVVALGAHRRRCPRRSARPSAATRRCRRGAGPAASRPARRPTSQALRRRDRLRVDGVEVAAGRQHVDQAAGRRAGRPGRRRNRRPARCSTSVDLVGGRGQPGHDLGGGERAAPRTTSGDRLAEHLGAPRPATLSASQPSVSIPTTSRRATASSRSTASAAVRGRPVDQRRSAPPAPSTGARRRPAAPARPGRTCAASAARRPGSAPRRRPRPGGRAARRAPG